MKKFLLVMTSLFLVSSLAFAVEQETENTGAASETVAENTTSVATAVAGSVAHTGAVVLTSSQNTPYSYK